MSAQKQVIFLFILPYKWYKYSFFCGVWGLGGFGLGVKCVWWQSLNMDELQTHFSFIYS
jgi:hypothetical protein